MNKHTTMIVTTGKLALSLALLLGLGGLGAQVRAAEGLKAEMGELARRIKEIMDQQRVDAITVGEFTGRSAQLANAGPSIQQSLTKELEARKVTVKTPAHYEIKGDYTTYDDKETGLTGVKITALLCDDNGVVSSIKLNPRVVHGNPDLYQMMGPTGDISPKGDQYERNKQIADAIKKPSCYVNGAKVCTTSNSPFAVEVLIKTHQGYAPRAARSDKGHAFVGLNKDEVYGLRLHNNTPHEVGAEISVDGLSIFAFSEKKAKNGDPFKYVIVPPKGYVDVKGWFINLKRTDEFCIVPKGDAAISKFKSHAKVGVITVAFAAAWPKGKDQYKPADEPKEYTTRSVETDRGNAITQDYKEVEYDYGYARATVSIRYSK